MHVYVCIDCYMAHHYGWHEYNGEWFAGDSDTPCNREPLRLLAAYEVSDDNDNGDQTYFGHASCEGCGSRLGGDRHRMYITDPAAGVRMYDDGPAEDDETETEDWADVDCVGCANGARHTHDSDDREQVMA